MTLERLRLVVPPPAEPVETGPPSGWDQVETALGTRLPGNYKQLIGTYGTGKFDDYLWLYNPFSSTDALNLLHQRDVVLGIYRELREEFPDRMPLPPFPKPGGVLPLGRTLDGDELYWITGGDPDGWPVLLTETSVYDEIYRHPVTEFLALVLTGEVTSKILPEDVAEQPHTFVQWS